MDKTEIENLIEEKAQTVFARNFGIFLEHLDDRFKLVQEGFQSVHEKMDRGFANLQGQLDHVKNNVDTLTLDVHELKTDVSVLKTDVSILKTDVSILKNDVVEVKEDLAQVKINTDTTSLEILALQDKDRESWRKTARLEEEYKLLDKRVERLETNYNYV